MADDEANEDFEINDSDLYYALNPHKRRRMTKEQQIYGVWAEKEDDREEERPSFGSTNSTFLNFVPGGTQAAGKPQEEGSAPSAPKKSKPTMSKPPRSEGFAGLRGSGAQQGGSADWLGKGSKIMNMMKKMGYEHGKGLGASKQGIVEPVEAKVRPGRAAVGAYGSEGKGLKFGESAADAQKRHNDLGEEEESEEAQPQAPRRKWKKSGAKQKVTYKTVDELIDSDTGGRMNFSGSGATKIIDMTGPVQKVYNDYNAFSTRTKSSAVVRSGFDVPELTHNLDLLLGMSEDQIRRNNRSVQTLKDQNEALESHLKELEESRANQRSRVKSIEQIIEILELFADNTGEQSLDDYKDLVIQLKTHGYSQFGSLSIDRCILSRILPVFVSHFSKWNIFDPEQALYGHELLKDWRTILGSSSKIGKNNELCAYDELLWNSWMPPVRRAALSWNPREATGIMVDLIENWAELLPRWMLDNLLDQLVFPRLHCAVDSWDPTSDPIPIHVWLHPWVSVMGDRVQPLLLTVRQKIGKALTNWDARDPSAMHLLSPWKDVFSRGTMSAFVGQHILPKLARSLNDMEMNPAVNNHYHEFQAVILWFMSGLLTEEATINVLLSRFFPKFYRTLCIWLDYPGVVRTEVSEWFTEWKSRFPQVLQQNPAIKNQFLGVLQAMKQSLSGLRVTGYVPQAHLDPVNAEHELPKPVTVQPARQADSGGFERATMRKIAQRRAEEAQIPLTPTGGMYHMHHLYKCGDRLVYFPGGDLIFAIDPESKTYKPIGLEALIEQCRNS